MIKILVLCSMFQSPEFSEFKSPEFLELQVENRRKRGKKDRGSSYHPDVIKSKRKRKDRGSKFHPGYVREPAPPYDYSKESLWNPDGTPKYKKIEGQGDAGPDNVWNTSDDPPGGTNPDWRKAEKAAKDAG